MPEKPSKVPSKPWDGMEEEAFGDYGGEQVRVLDTSTQLELTHSQWPISGNLSFTLADEQVGLTNHPRARRTFSW